ncbi:hypothetical protein [Pontibacter ruber]|uniref:DUF4468 domain-containing protein n=1 Tax=Pontibacter ruber TaxID=1343895 RepID=A0ABW5D055_9BACT|nr:hypothetical protein [Pontibacter ruber]
MLLFQTILPLFLFLFFDQPDSLQLNRDIDKDLRILENTSVYISDNTSLSPTVEMIASDLELFRVAASINLADGSYSSNKQGNHTVHTWRFKGGGNIAAIYQIESVIALDTVVTQRYLENRAPTQHRIRNNFTFRTYVVSTAATPVKLYYLSEAEQGLLKYKIDDRQVDLVYPEKKEGLSDILPKVEAELDRVLVSLNRQQH